MTFKDFIKLSWAKVILTIVLFILSLAIFEIPIKICLIVQTLPPLTECSVNIVGLILNLIISYLISCLIVFTYNRIRGKK